MIAKRVRKRGGQGLVALVRYVLREKGPPRDWTRQGVRASDPDSRGEAGRAEDGGGSDVDWIRVSGCGAVAGPARPGRCG